MKQRALSNRLSTILFMIDRRIPLIDVGCDLGLVGRRLLEFSEIPRVYFVDRSQVVIDKLKLVLGSSAFNERAVVLKARGEDLDWRLYSGTLLLSGLGAHAIISVLQTIPIERRGFFNLILSPNIREQDLRRYLRKEHWKFRREGCSVIRENHQFFQILNCQYLEGEDIEPWSPDFPRAYLLDQLRKLDSPDRPREKNLTDLQNEDLAWLREQLRISLNVNSSLDKKSI